MESGTPPTKSGSGSDKPQMPAPRETSSKDYPIGILVYLFLILLCTGVSFYKVRLQKRLPFFNPNDGLGFYWSESAFHFRHARMVAEGKAIPEIDVDIQYPEGLNIRRYITTLPDRVSGSLYRLLSPAIPLHVFLIYFVSIFSTLSVVAVFLAGRLLWRSNWAGFVSALFYCVTPASLARTTIGSLLREDFALPFIFLSFVCFVYTLREDRPIVALLGSLLLAIALASWHLTQFYLLIFVVGFVILFFLQKKHLFPRLGFTIFTAVTAAGALMLPVLRAKLFVFSFPLMLSYAMLIPLWLPDRLTTNGFKRRLWAALAIIFFLAAALIVQKYAASHSHVWSLILAKLRFFTKVPQDPTLLPFEARVFWAAGFVTSTPKDVLVLLSSTGLFGVIALFQLILRIFQNRNRREEIILVYFALSFLLLFFIIYRLHVFAVFFLSLSVGYFVTLKAGKTKIYAYFIMVACIALTVYSLRFVSDGASRPLQQSKNHLIRYIKANSAQNEAVLSSIQFGPDIAAYAQHPVILHSSFESKQIRDKVKQVYTSLYGSERDFYEVCKQYNASLFVYEAGMAIKSIPGTVRYFAANTSLAKNSAAALFQFAPEKLKYFGLVYQNGYYRIFRVGEKTSTQKVQGLPYSPLNDLSIFCDPHQLGENIDESIIAEGLEKLRRPETFKMLAKRFRSQGYLNLAILQYQRALSLDPKDTNTVLDLGEVLYQSGEKEKGLHAISLALANDPTLDLDSIKIQDSVFWLALGRNELVAERFPRAKSFLRRAVELAPESDEAYNLLGRVLAVSGERDKAIKAIEKSLSLNPDQPDLTTILNHLKAQTSSNQTPQ